MKNIFIFLFLPYPSHSSHQKHTYPHHSQHICNIYSGLLTNDPPLYRSISPSLSPHLHCYNIQILSHIIAYNKCKYCRAYYLLNPPSDSHVSQTSPISFADSDVFYYYLMLNSFDSRKRYDFFFLPIIV